MDEQKRALVFEFAGKETVSITVTNVRSGLAAATIKAAAAAIIASTCIVDSAKQPVTACTKAYFVIDEIRPIELV